MRNPTIWKFVLACMTALGTLIMGIGTASAASEYTNVCTPLVAFCEHGFSEPIGVAVDNSATASHGDVYVVEYATPQVLQFNEQGEKLSAFGLPGGSLPLWDAVDPTSGDLYVGLFSSETVEKLDPSGNLVAGFGTAGTVEVGGNPAGLAVDASGNLFVAVRGTGEVRKYSSTGTLIPGSFAVNHEGLFLGIAVHEDNVYVNFESPFEVVEYPASNREATKVIDTKHPTGIGVDPSTGDIYVAEAEPGEIAIYEPNGAFLTSFTDGFGEAGSFGLDVNATTHSVYASDRSNGVGDIFEEIAVGPPPPTPETKEPVEVTHTSATFHGTLNPAGPEEEVSYHFAYNVGTSCTGGATTPTEKVANANEKEVTAEATGLKADTQYTVCLVASNHGGSTQGNEVSFEAGKGKPIIEEQSAAKPTQSTEKVSAKITPEGAETTCTVEYGLEEGTYGSVAPCPALAEPEALTPQPVTVELSGLDPHTTYHYRFVATNSVTEEEGSSVMGPDATFSTPSTPVVTYRPPHLGRHEVTLSAEINVESAVTRYYIEYGLQEGKYDKGKTSEVELEAAAGTTSIKQILTELNPGTTYHYRIVATNETGTTEGPDATFLTTAPQPPEVKSESSPQVAQTTATIMAVINSNGLHTSYVLEVGTEVGPGIIAYTPSSGEVGPEPLTFSLTGLQPSITYHYRIVATNEDGTVAGPDQTFATLGFPSVITPPPPAQIVPTPPEVIEKEKIETRHEKYLKAVALCEKDRSKKKRAACLKKARKNYGPVVKKKKKRK